MIILQKISLKTHDSVSVGHPCLSPDDMMLIFASDMTQSANGEKSFGGRDLWYVTFDKRSKTWDSIPHNMGAMFNSAGNELFPSIGPKGQLYFASDGLPGIGGLDIFVAQREGEENKWTGTKNMGVPFNSQGNDYGMCDFDGRTGFFTSERKTSSSNEYTSDIWSYSIPPNMYDLRVIVYESGKKTKKLAGAKVTVTVSDGTTWEGTTDARGKVSWNEKADKKSRWILVGKDYTLKAGKEGYYEDKRGAKFSTVGLDQSQTFILEMPLLPIGEIRTPEVRYPVSQWTFINDATCMSLDSLKFLDSMLREYPNITIDLFSPNVSIVSPSESNNSNLSRTWLQVNATATDPYLKNITVWLYNSVGSVVNSLNCSSDKSPMMSFPYGVFIVLNFVCFVSHKQKPS